MNLSSLFIQKGNSNLFTTKEQKLNLRIENPTSLHSVGVINGRLLIQNLTFGDIMTESCHWITTIIAIIVQRHIVQQYGVLVRCAGIDVVLLFVVRCVLLVAVAVLMTHVKLLMIHILAGGQGNAPVAEVIFVHIIVQVGCNTCLRRAGINNFYINF